MRCAAVNADSRPSHQLPPESQPPASGPPARGRGRTVSTQPRHAARTVSSVTRSVTWSLPTHDPRPRANRSPHRLDDLDPGDDRVSAHLGGAGPVIDRGAE